MNKIGVAVGLVLCVLPMAQAQGQATGILRLLESYAGATPSAGEVLLAAGGSPKAALEEVHHILRRPENKELWPGAILASGVLAARGTTEVALAELGLLEKFLAGKKYYQSMGHGLDDVELANWEDAARMLVPEAVSYLAAHDPAPTEGNELHGRSGPQPATSLDLLKRILTGETKPEWASTNAQNGLELRFKALNALASSGRQDALARIEEAKAKLRRTPTLASEASLILNRAREASSR